MTLTLHKNHRFTVLVSCIGEQNRRQKVFNKEDLLLCGRLDILKFNNSTDLQCFISQVRGTWSSVWGISPPKTPMATGLVVSLQFTHVRSFSCRGRLANLLADCFADGLACGLFC